MTITDSGRLSPEEMERARELYASGITSKSGMQRGLKVGWAKAEEALDKLSREAAERERRQAEQRRARLAKVKPRKTRASRLPVRSGSLPDTLVSPAAYPMPVPISPAAAGVFAGPPAPLPDVPVPASPVAVPEPVAPAAEPVPEEAPAPTTEVFRRSTATLVRKSRSVPRWPLLLLAMPAFVAIWSGWVGLGGLTGFGVVHPLPGIADDVSLNTAITLPIGLETYGTYALFVWLSGAVPPRARRFAMWSAIGSLTLGALGQVAYHVMAAAGITAAPWWITTIVACLPVAVLGMGAALYHLVNVDEKEN